MKLSHIVFLSLGGAAIYYGANFPLVDTEELKITKNYFNSSYTMQMDGEGIVMKFDKRYEKEMSATTEALQAVVKISKIANEEGKADAKQLKEQANEKIREALKFR